MSSLPTGTVTFLFTDIEGSTKRWERQPDAMSAVLARHDALLRAAIEANGGHVFKTMGDAFCAAFPTASQALNAALAVQRAMQAEDWGEVSPLRVRMALHAGIVEMRDGDYFGQPLNRVARLLSVGHGGQTLLSHLTYELVRDHLPPQAGLLDMGAHRLKDLIRSEHVFQLTAHDLRVDFPALKTLDYLPNNLPVQPTALIGREGEMQAVCSLLRRPDVRLVTLTGAGGIGKTRLGLQVATDLLDDCKDGVFFVSLATLITPNLVVSTIAQALGVRESGSQPLFETLQEYLRDKQLLLLLDNFEHIVEAAPFVSDLLGIAPQVKVLVTSREMLRLRGERNYSVPPLDLPDLKHLPTLEQLAQYEAIRLFIERAEAVKLDFAVTQENAPAVAEICVRLDGLPLAIELAAARIKILSPQAILTRLESRLKLLTGGARDVPARQQTLRNTIEWSYDLLDEGEQQLFRRLAVFAGGRTLEAVEAVCNTKGDLKVNVLDGVESLVSKNLMQQYEGAGGEPRFWMLETIHEYAREKLDESGEGEETQRKHAQYFLALAEEAEPELTGARSVEWLARLEEEHDNLRTALRWAKERGGNGDAEGDAVGVEVGLRIAGALWRFWEIRGYFSEGREQLVGMLALPALSTAQAPLSQVSQAPQTQSQSLHLFKAKALNGAGVLAWLQGDYANARSLHEESLAIKRELGDKQGIASSLNNLGLVAYDQGDYANARSLYEESLAISRELGDKRGIANCVINLGNVAYQQGDYATVRSLCEESLAIGRELGDKYGISSSLNNLGLVAYAQGDYANARSLHEESLAIGRELGNKWGIAHSLNNLGNVAHQQGDYASARSLYEESLAIRRELGDKQGIAESLMGLGGVAPGVGQEQERGLAQPHEQAQRQAERGARLLGAAEALLEAIGTALDPDDRMVYEQGIASARAQLSEEEFEKARAEGRAMTMEQAIQYALEDTDPPPL